MSDNNVQLHSAVPTPRPPERWIARSLKRHPLISFPFVLFPGQCIYIFAVELLIPRPSLLVAHVAFIFFRSFSLSLRQVCCWLSVHGKRRLPEKPKWTSSWGLASSAS